MADRALQHRRLHNLLLIQKLLGLKGESSPFTLVPDTVEQSAKPLIRHYIHNAKVGVHCLMLDLFIVVDLFHSCRKLM
jgi:elongator complex protein 5